MTTEADEGEKKRISQYRSYLLKLGRAVAMLEASRNGGKVIPTRVRERLILRGELVSFMDDKWMAKVLTPRLYKQMATYSWKILEEIGPDYVPKRYPLWEGVRPTEDPLRDSERSLMMKLSTM